MVSNALHSSVSQEELQAARRSAKRKRAAKACTRCKVKKVKCSGFCPCTRCINPAECIFPTSRSDELNARPKDVKPVDIVEGPTEQCLESFQGPISHMSNQFRQDPLRPASSPPLTSTTTIKHSTTFWVNEIEGNDAGTDSVWSGPNSNVASMSASDATRQSEYRSTPNTSLQPYSRPRSYPSNPIDPMLEAQTVTTQPSCQPQFVSVASVMEAARADSSCAASSVGAPPAIGRFWNKTSGGSAAFKAPGVGGEAPGEGGGDHAGCGGGGWICPPRAWLQGAEDPGEGHIPRAERGRR